MPSTSYSVRQMVELAANLAHESSAWVSQPRLAESSLASYWLASQTRNELWHQFLTPGKVAWTDLNIHGRPTLLDWIEEIALSEMVTRIWTALAVARDLRHGGNAFTPVVRRVYGNHLEVRRRVLRLLLDHPPSDQAMMVALNQTLRRVERWTDLLLGYVLQLADVAEFAHSPERARDHQEGLRFESLQSQGHYTWPLVLASLRSTFSTYARTVLPNPRWNHQVQISILASCGAGQFDSVGLFSTLWQSRLSYFSDDAERLLAELLEI